MSLLRRLTVPRPFDLAASWSAIMGPGGNTTAVAHGVFRLAARNSHGTVQMALQMDRQELLAEAWGWR